MENSILFFFLFLRPSLGTHRYYFFSQLRMTPLHWAVERGCCGTVEALLKHGANPNIESKFDKTPLEIASENGRPDIFEILQVNRRIR